MKNSDQIYGKEKKCFIWKATDIVKCQWKLNELTCLLHMISSLNFKVMYKTESFFFHQISV